MYNASGLTPATHVAKLISERGHCINMQLAKDSPHCTGRTQDNDSVWTKWVECVGQWVNLCHAGLQLNVANGTLC